LRLAFDHLRKVPPCFSRELFVGHECIDPESNAHCHARGSLITDAIDWQLVYTDGVGCIGKLEESPVIQGSVRPRHESNSLIGQHSLE
jgi:hypothetical protein